jgi:hypothetical protein
MDKNTLSICKQSEWQLLGGVNGGWVQYDEQFRLRKARYPTSSWGVVDMELWLLCVATPKFSTVQRPFNTGLVNQHSNSSLLTISYIMVERVTTGDNLGTICAGHLIGGNVLLVGIANTCINVQNVMGPTL